ncbi:MAG: alpha/beta hydrolase [Bryobacteraceae bacterium]|nr:alpha/beta hydrolase [Bryobacteraceae bacterium]
MLDALGRREFLALLASQAATKPAPKTYTYKTAGPCEIKADVYGAEGGVRKPVLMWVHGGALIMGDRRGIPAQFLTSLLDAGFAVVSIDYRLAPETKLPEIIADLKDACAWVRTKGPSLFNADGGRLTVSGGSAGGYLTLMSGFHAAPPPRALVSFWGYGDIIGPWYSRPDEFYNRQPAVPKEKAYAAVGSAPLAEPPEKNERGTFYLYCRQQGIWPQQVAGRDPFRDAAWFKMYCPVRNVTPAYPPTLLIHGTRDTDVPYEQSVMMARELEKNKVKHELITVPDGGHGFRDVDPALVTRIYAQAVAFLKRAV